MLDKFCLKIGNSEMYFISFYFRYRLLCLRIHFRENLDCVRRESSKKTKLYSGSLGIHSMFDFDLFKGKIEHVVRIQSKYWSYVDTSWQMPHTCGVKKECKKFYFHLCKSETWERRKCWIDCGWDSFDFSVRLRLFLLQIF